MSEWSWTYNDRSHGWVGVMPHPVWKYRQIDDALAWCVLCEHHPLGGACSQDKPCRPRRDGHPSLFRRRALERGEHLEGE
jgi:hypothetical protein